MHTVGKINRDLYKGITEDILTDEVIITDERITHIEERHPGDYVRYGRYISEILMEPDYIIKASKANTAVVLKETKNNEKLKLILKLKTRNDPAGYENSIITFWHIGEVTWKRSIKNREIVYKRE